MASVVTTHNVFVPQQGSVTPQRAEHDEGAKEVNFNLIKWVRLLISNICCAETMTLW